jgi:hypothetical protein
MPVGHDAQAAVPDDDAYEPAAQREQTAVSAVGAELPTGHGVQLTEEAPKKPGAQTEQPNALALPMAEPAVVVLTRHTLQPDARDEPLFATMPKKPDAHAVHATSHAPAACALVVVTPRGQDEHCEAPMAE